MAWSPDDIIESLKNFNPDDLNDLNQVGSWPMAVKVIIWLIAFVGALAAGYFAHVTNLQAELAKTQKTELNLRTDYESKFFEAAHLEAYKKQQIEMEEAFKVILAQLPGETEIPGLIEDITLVGLQNGLTFSSIDLLQEVSHEFYIEKPIRIKVSGSYHDIGSFVSDVADLSRIVTLHNFSIAPSGGKRGAVNDNRGILSMEILAKTYRYNDERG
ncbi:MAG: type 4a pilus biogenesis protein PilO [Pseudomonadales bacterium]|nr:type 4a pilus biogenesis protein PilO [Pseudomonadales bacterium]